MSATTSQVSLRSTGVSDLAFDLMTVLQNKLQAIEAMEKYKDDARKADHHHALRVFTDIQEADATAAQQLRAMVSHELVEGLEDQHGFDDRSGTDVQLSNTQVSPGDEDARVSEASEDSFPASDPPAYNKGHHDSVT